MVVAAAPKSFRRSLGSNALAAGALPIATILIAPLIARALGPEGRGGLAAGTALLVLLLAVGSFGLPESTTYWIAKRPDAASTLAKRAVVCSCVAGVLVTAAMFPLVSVLADGDRPTALSMSIAVMVLLPNLVGLAVRGIAMGHGYWTLAARERYLTALIRVTGIFTLFFLDLLTVATATVVIALSSVAGAFVYLSMLGNGGTDASLSRSKHRLRERVSRAEYIGYANRIWIGIAGGAILSRISQVLMPSVSTVEQLGIFVVAVNIADASIVISIAIRDVVFAESAREGGVERLCKAARFSLVLTTAFGLAAIASSPLWLTLIFGPEFKGALIPMIILLAAFALGTPGSIAGAGLSSIGRPGLRSVAVVIGAAINVFLLFVVAGPFGAVGASLATLVANLVCALTVSAMYVRLTEATWKRLYLPTPSDFVAGAQIVTSFLNNRNGRMRTPR